MNQPVPFCQHCGSKLPSGACFCESCGQPVSGAPAVAPQVVPAAQACPNCGQFDKVFTAEAFNARTFSEADTQAADEADRNDPEAVQIYLEKPEAPLAPSYQWWMILPFIPLANFLFCWFAPMHRGYKFFMLGIVAVFWACVFIPQLYAVSAYAFVGCFFVLFYYAALFIDRDRQKAIHANKEMPAYQTAAARWPSLRYCDRCELAWLEQAPQHAVPVDQAQDLLNK